jgi:putative two-component system response regulator
VLTTDLRRAQEHLQSQYDAVTDLSDTILEQARALKNHASVLEDRVQHRTQELEEAHREAIYMLAAASEAKDGVTGDHVRRVEGLTARLALAMGVSSRAAERMGRAAVLHDVGKLHVPDDILKKPGPLSDAERAVMQQHTTAGEQILPDRPFYAQARHIARSHHENWDGTGYPDGLRGGDIPLAARLVHLADVFDALTHDRPYKLAWREAEAVAYIQAQAGKMFDPETVQAFSGLENFEPNAAAS